MLWYILKLHIVILFQNAQGLLCVFHGILYLAVINSLYLAKDCICYLPVKGLLICKSAVFSFSWSRETFQHFNDKFTVMFLSVLQKYKFCKYFTTEFQRKIQIYLQQRRLILDSLRQWLWGITSRDKQKHAGNE